MSHDIQARIDAAGAKILRATRTVAQRCVDLGVPVDRLNEALRPWLVYIARWRALNVEPLEAVLERERLEARQLH